MADKAKNLKWIIIGIILLVAIIVGAVASIYIDLIWFKSVQYVTVFWKILLTKGVVMLFFAAAFFILSFINLSFARRFCSGVSGGNRPGRVLKDRRFNYLKVYKIFR